MGKTVVSGDAVKKVLYDGAIIILNDIKSVFEPKYYRFKDKLEYSYDLKIWKSSEVKIDYLKECEYLVIGEIGEIGGDKNE